MIIRDENPGDIQAIHDLTMAAFENHPISRQTEQFIVKALRDAGALSISLVAEVGGQVVGHIAFSPVTISDGTENWYGCGPFSVLPEHQRRGFGKALLAEGLAELRKLGGKGCALVGDPNYYSRFGFKNYPELIHEGVPPEVFLVLPFTDEVPEGKVVFHGGFQADG